MRRRPWAGFWWSDPGDAFASGTEVGTSGSISTGWSDPERSEDATCDASPSHGQGLLNGFFPQNSTHPGSHPIDPTPARNTLRELLREKFHNHFWPAKAKTDSGPSAAAFSPWRTRASHPGGRYSGLCRGTWFLNHLLAITAVLPTAGSLVLMGKTSTQLTGWVQDAADLAPLTGAAAKSTAKPHSPAWLMPMIKGQVIHDKPAPYREIRDSRISIFDCI